jgi:hypothetical protein
MKIFHCNHCQNLVFFESFQCLSCGHALAYLPDLQMLGSLEPGPDTVWHSPVPAARGRAYRRCSNYDLENVCNWAVSADDPNPLCLSCRLTRVIPDLSRPGNKEAWYKMEAAKRRLVYSLLSLKLPIEPKQTDPTRRPETDAGLIFEFLADVPGSEAALTGHDNGVITINLAEADDAQRENRRAQLHEPYRTLLGHFRHEIGHYYWDRLIAKGDRLEAFRNLFGDERADYGEALKRHYGNGAPGDWQQSFVSAYASSHPWEDWAESWAQYLHMLDALETAAACGLALKPLRSDEPSLKTDARAVSNGSFDRLIGDWFPLTYVLNNLNRSLGLPDGYPFVLSSAAVEKLRFVHETIERTPPEGVRTALGSASQAVPETAGHR